MRRREGGGGRDSGLGVLLCVVAVFRISLRSNPSRLLPSRVNTPVVRLTAVISALQTTK